MLSPSPGQNKSEGHPPAGVASGGMEYTELTPDYQEARVHRAIREREEEHLDLSLRLEAGDGDDTTRERVAELESSITALKTRLP